MENLAIYSSEELKRIQQLELCLLQNIAQICQRNRIEYFLIGGTALGAVRHSGFIPWDDDIDVGMTRNNYERFIAIAKTQLPNGYTIQTPLDNRHCPYYYSKIRVDGTTFMEYCNRNINMHQGVYVDIFPFDNVPDDEVLNKNHFSRVQRLIRLFSLRQIPDVSSEPINLRDRLRARFRYVLHMGAMCIPHSFLARKLHHEFTRFNNTETSAIACLNFPVFKTEYILKKDLYPFSFMRFVDDEYPIPGNYDQYLKTHYGDYMTLPPKEKRFGHRPFMIKL